MKFSLNFGQVQLITWLRLSRTPLRFRRRCRVRPPLPCRCRTTRLRVSSKRLACNKKFHPPADSNGRFQPAEITSTSQSTWSL